MDNSQHTLVTKVIDQPFEPAVLVIDSEQIRLALLHGFPKEIGAGVRYLGLTVTHEDCVVLAGVDGLVDNRLGNSDCVHEEYLLGWWELGDWNSRRWRDGATLLVHLRQHQSVIHVVRYVAACPSGDARLRYACKPLKLRLRNAGSEDAFDHGLNSHAQNYTLLNSECNTHVHYIPCENE